MYRPLLEQKRGTPEDEESLSLLFSFRLRLRGLFDPGFFGAHGQPQVAAGAVGIAFRIYMCTSRFVFSSSFWAQFPSSLPFSFSCCWSHPHIPNVFLFSLKPQFLLRFIPELVGFLVSLCLGLGSWSWVLVSWAILPAAELT
jgi:hypothetical protein